MKNLSGFSVPKLGQAAAAAGETVLSGTAIDTSGFFNALVDVYFGSVGVSAGTPNIKVQTSPDNTNWTDVTGSQVTIVDTTWTNKVYRFDLTHVKHKYVRTVITRTGSGNLIAVVGAFWLLYDTRVNPGLAATLTSGGAVGAGDIISSGVSNDNNS